MEKPTCFINWRVLISATDRFLPNVVDSWESSDAPVRCCMPISSKVLKHNELSIQGGLKLFQTLNSMGNSFCLRWSWPLLSNISNPFDMKINLSKITSTSEMIFCTLGTSADPLHRSRQPSHAHPAIRRSSVCQAMLWDRMTTEDTGVIWDIHECVKGDII